MAKPRKLVTLTFHIDLPITSDEAWALLKSPKSTIAKKLKQYWTKLLYDMADKALDECKKENKKPESEDV